MGNCGGCFYYREDAGSLILTGQKSCVCRRFPPQGFAIVQQGLNGQPVQSIMYRQAETKPEGWCGEWRAMPQAEATTAFMEQLNLIDTE